MSPHALDHRLQRILRVRADLQALDQRVKDAEGARDAASHAFARARAVMEETSDEVTGLYSRQRTILAELDALRQSYICDSVASLPSDVLRWIFEEVVALPQSMVRSAQAPRSYRKEYAIAPFRLAAVSRRWRSLALEQSRLWTYISAPDNMDAPHAGLHLERIRLLVQRSKHAPLDVLLYFRMKTSPHTWAQSLASKRIIDLLSAHAFRWRTFELSLPKEASGNNHIAAIKGPLPLLERLYFNDHGWRLEIDDPVRGCIPFAPQLQDLLIWGPSGIQAAPSPLLPVLKKLSLWAFSLDMVWPLLSAAAPSLESLILGGDLSDPHAVTPITGVVFPKLSSLVIDNLEETTINSLSNVRMPLLDQLALGAGAIDALSSLLQQLSPSVHFLKLMRNVTRSDINTLRFLTNVRALRFAGMAQFCNPKFTYSVSDDFFAAIPCNVWPKLVSVEFHSTGTFDPEDGTGTLTFIRSRTAPARRADGTTTLARLQEFITKGNLPPWFVNEVDRLLSLR